MALQVDLTDAKDPMRVIFGWSTGGQTAPNYSMIDVTLECPWAFKVSGSIGNPNQSTSRAILGYLKEIASLGDEWEGSLSFQTPDGEFVITCYECRTSRIFMEFSLDASWDDPEWTVQLRLAVDQSQWPGVVGRFEEFFAQAHDNSS